ncbi:LOW QUALITY PROTEIN: hypothetical protein N665_0999s0003 [Sinapis alba]|nr:LOW QUALITY PROTEIN: hypothetical protein N665_0999s0003 [Sinapis alba]
MAAVSSLFLVFTLFIVSLLIVLALIVRPRSSRSRSSLGLAEALQQEVISHDIHVTLLFPPDTDTPGFQEEQKKRPELTSIIAASSGSMKTKEVAKICLDGIKAGKFSHFIGYLLSIATSGMSPQRSFWHAFMEVMFGGLIRFVSLFFQWGWYNTIDKWSNSKTKHPIAS